MIQKQLNDCQIIHEVRLEVLEIVKKQNKVQEMLSIFKRKCSNH